MRSKGFHCFTILFAIAAIVLVTQVAAADVLQTEDFETDGNGVRYTLTEECTDGSGDFFTRTDGSNIGSFVEYTGPNNAFFFAAMDTNGAPCTLNSESIELNATTTTNYGTLMVYAVFAEDDSTDGAEDWDDDSQVILEASLDGGAYAPLICFAAHATDNNTEPGLDADCDGVRDGAALTPTFTEYSAAIAGTPDSVQLRIRVENLTSGDEDIAFDYIRLEGVIVPVELQSFQID